MKGYKFGTTIILTALAMACAMTGCDNSTLDADFSAEFDKIYGIISGSGNISSKDVSLSDGLYKVSAEGISSIDSTIKVEIIASGNSAEIEADDNVIDSLYFEIDNENKTITLKSDPDIIYKNINYTITINALVNEVEVDGITEVNYMVPDNSDSICITASGSSTVVASGSCKNAEYWASGAVNIDASLLQAKELSVHASGASKATVNVSDKLEISASGTSSVVYYGDPETVQQDVSGLAAVKSD